MNPPKWSWVLSALVIAGCLGVSFWYFAQGFLLTRVELEDRTPLPPPNAERAPPPFRRAVIVILDAMRFDFLWSSVAGPDADDSTGSSSKGQHHYSGKLTAFAEAARDPRARTWFYEGLADAPTTTMQRLKALTTGGLPTFVDVGANFNTAAVHEDSWVAQARAAGLRVGLAGDDTWLALFPGAFDPAHAFPSFDVMDLDSVDAGVAAHLVPELRRNASDVLVAHLLGVDHAGHRHGADHPAMGAKLAQLNALLRSVLAALPPDTLLAVLGDHGMTEDGNHGGASAPEVSAGLVLHYRAPAAPPRSLAAKRALVARAAALTGFPVTHRCALAHARTVHQIDLVPTLAAALGFPIPFGNLGMVLPEPFLDMASSSTTHVETETFEKETTPTKTETTNPMSSGTTASSGTETETETETTYPTSSRTTATTASSSSEIETETTTKEANDMETEKGLENLRQVATENAEQINKYLHAYAARVPSFAGSVDMPALDALLRRARREEGAGAQVARLYAYYARAAEACRRLWASLDRAQMCWGAVLAGGAAAMLVAYVAAAAKGLDDFPASGLVSGAALGVVYAHAVRHWALPVVGRYAPLPACVALGVAVCFVVDTLATVAHRRRELAATAWQTVLALAAALAHAAGMLSNSYEEAEAAVARHLVLSLAAVVFCACALGPGSRTNLRVLAGGTWRHIVLLALVVRVSALFAVHGARLEALPIFGAGRAQQHLALLAFSLAPLAALSWLAARYLWEPARTQRTRAPQTLSNLALALVGLYWFVSQFHATTPVSASAAAAATTSAADTTASAAAAAAPMGTTAHKVLRWARLLLPHGVWALSALSAGIVAVRAFRGTRPVRTAQGGVGLLMPIGYGSLLAAAAAPVVLAMGPHAALPAALMAVQLCLVADLCKKLGYRSCVLAGVLAALTGIQYFYATGHTPQISDIAFDAAFVGFEKTHWAAGFVLVLLNTVGAPLLCLAALPLLRPPFEHYELRRWWLFVALLSFFAVSALALCATTLFIFLEPRHLMIWRVFCPRLLFDAGMTAVYFLGAVVVILITSINKLRW